MRRSLSPLLVLPGFLGFTVAIPSYQSANATERDDNGTNADVGANSKSASLESFCAAQLSSFTATYQSTEIATSRWTWYEGFGPTDSAGDLTGSVTSQTYWTSTFLCKYCEMQDILFVIRLFLLFSVFSLLGFPIPSLFLFSALLLYHQSYLPFLSRACDFRSNCVQHCFYHCSSINGSPQHILFSSFHLHGAALIFVRYPICLSCIHACTTMLWFMLYDGRHDRLLLLA